MVETFTIKITFFERNVKCRFFIIDLLYWVKVTVHDQCHLLNGISDLLAEIPFSY